MKAIFVAGTDTGVGKTIVTGLLARYFTEKGYTAITQKWIQTGSSDNSSDIQTHLKIMGQGRNFAWDYLPQVSPYIFKTPCSPHLAASLEKKSISEVYIKRCFKQLDKKFDFVIVEGLGGVLVPFNNKRFVIDIAKDLDLDVLLVAENKLGAINHTLLTIEALTARKMRILGVVFNNCLGQSRKVLEDNPRIVRALSRQQILGVLPWMGSDDDTRLLYKKFIPIGKRVSKELLNG